MPENVILNEEQQDLIVRLHLDYHRQIIPGTENWIRNINKIYIRENAPDCILIDSKEYIFEEVPGKLLYGMNRGGEYILIWKRTLLPFEPFIQHIRHQQGVAPDPFRGFDIQGDQPVVQKPAKLPKYHIYDGCKFSKPLSLNYLKSFRKYGYEKFIQLNPSFKYEEDLKINEHEEIIVNVYELADFYTKDYLNNKYGKCDIKDHSEEYTEVLKKQIKKIKSFKRNENG